LRRYRFNHKVSKSWINLPIISESNAHTDQNDGTPQVCLPTLVEPEWYLPGSCKNGDHALELATTFRPEVTSFDIQMPGPSAGSSATNFRVFTAVFITASANMRLKRLI
jgi:hypothetical protein